MDLRNLIPKGHPSYFIKNVVDLIDYSEANQEFHGKPGEFAYPRELSLRLILISVFDGILSSRDITQNPTDHFELIPSIEQLENNLTGIYEELPSNFQFSTYNEYSTDDNTTYLEENGIDGYISARKLSRKEKKYNL